MALYENTFIIRQDLSEQAIEALTDQFSAIINSGGEVKKREYWGLKSFAYKINKAKKGHYIFLAGAINDAKVIDEIKQRVALSEGIVRHLIVKVDAISEVKSPAIKEKDGE